MTKARSNATAPNAKGTLVVGNGTDASTTLAVASTAGYVLTVDSAEATGVKWAAVAGSSGPTFSAYVGTTHQVSAATWTKMQFNTENWDSDSCYDTSLYRFTPNKAGKYQVNVGDFLYDGADYRMDLYKNGSQHKTIGYMEPEPSGLQPAFYGSTLVDMNGSTDYLEVYVFMRKSAGTRRVEAGSIISRFDAVWIRS